MSKNNILYLDTSELTAHLALFVDGKKTEEVVWEAGRELSKTLSKNYEALLERAGVTSNDVFGICVFVGPGSFTGLRIGLSFANGLAYALDIPVYETLKKDLLDLSNRQEIALPFYGAEPKITKPKDKS